MPLLGERLATRMVPEILQSGRRGERLSDAEVALFARHVPPHVSVAMYRSFLTLGSSADRARPLRRCEAGDAEHAADR